MTTIRRKMRIRHHAPDLLPLATTALAACLAFNSVSVNAYDASQKKQHTSTSTPAVVLTHGRDYSPCSGGFILELCVDGKVVFEGLSNVASVGRRHTHVAKERIESIVNQLEISGFMNLQNNYIRPGIADASVESISYQRGEIKKVVQYETRNPELAALGTAIRKSVPDEQLSAWINPMPACQEKVLIR